MTEMETKLKLTAMRKTQTALAEELRKMGIQTSVQEVNMTLNDPKRKNFPKTRKILKAAERVIERWEEDAAKKKVAP